LKEGRNERVEVRREAEEASGSRALVLSHSAMSKDRRSDGKRKVKLNILK
jgi:hypothetical protein